MPQSHANVLIHLVFSTKGRTPCIRPEVRPELYSYLGGVFRQCDAAVLRIGGHIDHVHVLYRHPRTVTIAQLVEKVKTSSSKWMKSHGVPDFAWQSGYGAFSVGVREVEQIVGYIQNQEEHHRVVTFQDELRELLREAGIEFDERYVWD